MNRKRRNKTFFISLLLIVILCFGTIPAHARKLPIIPPVQREYLQLNNGAQWAGGGPHEFSVFQFTLPEPSMVTLTNIVHTGREEKEPVPFPFLILDEDGVVLFEDIILENDATSSVCLLDGTYFLYIGYEGGDYISYHFRYECSPLTDQYSETSAKKNNSPETAIDIRLGQFVSGSVCANEAYVDEEETGAGIDFYRFRVYGDSRPSPMDIETYFDFHAVLLILDENKSPVKTIDLGDGDSRFSLSTIALSPGTYYLGIGGDTPYSSGSYTLCVDDRSAQDVRLGKVYTTVGGETTVFGKNSSYGQLNNYWESSGKKIADVTDDRLKGYKVGRTEISGYGEQLDHMGKYHYTMDAFVEFTDVQHGKKPYYYKPVYWAVDHGITSGVKDKNGLYSKFAPQDDCTRAQIVSFLWRMEGCPEPKTATDFRDVSPSDYFYKAVSWAQENGIVGGYSDGTFRPKNVCTRGHVVTFLYRMRGCPQPESTDMIFTDVDPKAYYYKSVLWANENGITGGYSDNTFRPGNNCSRGQTVTFLYRYYQLFLNMKD